MYRYIYRGLLYVLSDNIKKGVADGRRDKQRGR